MRTEWPFQEVIPEGDMYAKALKWPTPEEMKANNNGLLFTLSEARDKKGNNRFTLDELSTSFGYSIEETRQVIKNAKSLRENPIPQQSLIASEPITHPPFQMSPGIAINPDMLLKPIPESSEREEEAPSQLTQNHPNGTAKDEEEREAEEAVDPDIRARLRGIFDKPREKEEPKKPINRYEVDFYKGLNFGSFQREKLGTNDNNRRIKISTDSKSPAFRDLVRNTIGTRGVTKENDRRFTVYLDDNSFSFLESQEVGRAILGLKEHFAPFFLGLIYGRMSEKEHRISHRDPTFIKGIAAAYARHFGEGDLEYTEEHHGDKPVIHVLTLPNPSKVVRQLLRSPRMQELPFYEYLKQELQNSNKSKKS